MWPFAKNHIKVTKLYKTNRKVEYGIFHLEQYPTDTAVNKIKATKLGPVKKGKLIEILRGKNYTVDVRKVDHKH